MYIYLFSRFLWAWHDNQTGEYNAIEIVTGCYTFYKHGKGIDYL